MSPTERISDPTLLVLTSLAEGDKHGYAIMTDVEQFAGVKLGPGTLYGAIQRLEEKKLIEAVSSGDRRQPYRLTHNGREFLKEQLTQLRAITKLGLSRMEAL
jgi:DNA-binding PadR family transcriptional regulator